MKLALQAALNPSGVEVVRCGRTYRVGDKVMQIKNDYDREVFNRDIGRVTGIDEEEQELTVDIEGRPIVYDFSGLDELVLAYGVSIHKSTGVGVPSDCDPYPNSALRDAPT